MPKIKKIYVGQKIVRPLWKPGANTLLYCPLKDNIDDATGNHTMTSSGVSKGTIGYIFGSGSYIKTSDSFAGPQYATISIWQKRSSANDNSLLASKCTNGTTPYHYFGIKYQDSTNKNKIDLEVSISGGGSNPVAITGGTDLSLNTRYNIIATFDGSSMSLYVNNQLYNTRSVSGTLLTTSSGFSIGNFTNFNQYFQGEISEVIFENKARTAQEVLDYYNQTKSLYGVS